MIFHGDIAIIASASVSVKVFLVCLVAIVGVVLYRAAFPSTVDEEDAPTDHRPSPEGVSEVPGALAPPTGQTSHSPAGPLIDTRPRMRCPQCSEFILVEARLCRFCGVRFADKLETSTE
jgi:hypothetical protein